MSTALRGLLLGALVAGCIVKKVESPRLTGTCAGACDHYVECKPGHAPTDRDRCARECPNAFGDPDSLMAYESLSCQDAVEYVDGTAPRAAGDGLH
ncbi:MAG TPA: hypothetical protein VGL61_21690 [Kofleriaceae bacterium]|jgi:hypothetical protein